jgi:hypothetical protein
MRELTRSRVDQNLYVSAVRQRVEELERMFEADRRDPALDRDAGWDSETLRAEVRTQGLAPDRE